MKKLILLTALGIMAACNNSGQTQEETHGHEHHSTPAQTPELNEGEKWTANPETTAGINDMMMRIRGFEEEQNTDYPQLQKQLQNDFQVIINECTMKGEAHDQLHVYLMPLKSQIDRLSAKNMDTIKNHLQHYNRYFE